MERFQRFENSLQHQQSTSSSVYSDHDAKPSTTSDSYTESRTSTSSRPVSSVPSYMNAVPTRKPIKSTPLSTASDLNAYGSSSEGVHAQSTMPASAAMAKGILLVAIADEPHVKTISYIEMMLKRAAYSSIVVLGSQWREAELKQLKMDTFAVLGRRSLEAGVQLELHHDWDEVRISEVVSRLKGSDAIHGVLCSPMLRGASSDHELGWDAPGPLEMDEGEFDLQWKSSVAFLRNVAKTTMLSSQSSTDRTTIPNVFLVTDPGNVSTVDTIYKAACDQLLTLIAREDRGTTVAYADTVLIPEPEVESKNGRLDLDTHADFHNGGADDFPAGESPTKLWNMWALQDELNVAY